MSISSTLQTTGTYSTIDSTYTSSDCTNPDRKYTFNQYGDMDDTSIKKNEKK